MRFPVTIRHRSSKAKIYRPAGKFNYYRVAYTVAGKRRMQTFANYPDAKAAAERIVRDMANGSQAAAFTASQSRDALAALQCLESFRQSTGRRVSLLEGISKYVGAVSKLNGRDLDEAVTGYLQTVANVKRKDIKEAVAEFLQADAPRTKAAEGQRAQLSAKYAYNRELQLDRFAAMFPNTAVCELSKEGERAKSIPCGCAFPVNNFFQIFICRPENFLTRRPATHNRPLIHAHGFNADASRFFRAFDGTLPSNFPAVARMLPGHFSG
ncbi:MAG: hypothetical protein WBN75_17650 [Verrucomicrobiia bacterium]